MVLATTVIVISAETIGIRICGSGSSIVNRMRLTSYMYYVSSGESRQRHAPHISLNSCGEHMFGCNEMCLLYISEFHVTGGSLEALIAVCFRRVVTGSR